MKRKPQTSEELATAWKQGKLSIHTALKRHLQNIEVWPVDPGFFMILPVLIGYANMGVIDKVIPLGKDQDGQDVQRTVAQIIEDLGLQPFLNESEEAK